MDGVRTRFYADIMAFNPEVTGSCKLVVVKYPNGETTKFVVDCGLFQESNYEEENKKLLFDPTTLDFVLVTHNHIDHTGRLPLLTARGYRKNMYMTYITQKLLRPALRNSYSVLKSIAKRNNTSALFSNEDVSMALNQTVGIRYEEEFNPVSNIKVVFFKNGHIPGAAVILVQISYEDYEPINIIFTGDYNNKNMFYEVPSIPDYVRELPLTIVQEATYGNMNSTKMSCCFEDNIVNAIRKRKTALLLVFSLGRAQEILYIIKKLQDAKKIAEDVTIYLDGKLCIAYTSMYQNEDFEFKEEMKDFFPKNLKMVDETIRKEIIEDTNCKIIITTSGTGSYGPAQTYIPALLSREDVLIHFTGYTPKGTLGRKLKDTIKGETVKVAGLIVIKKADVEYTTEYSAHAKADVLIEFLNQFAKPKLVLVEHGENSVKEEYAERVLRETYAQYVGILGANYIFRVSSYGLVKTIGAKFK